MIDEYYGVEHGLGWSAWALTTGYAVFGGDTCVGTSASSSPLALFGSRQIVGNATAASSNGDGPSPSDRDSVFQGRNHPPRARPRPIPLNTHLLPPPIHPLSSLLS